MMQSTDMIEQIWMVPKAGVEPARPKAQPPQDCVSASSTTSALINEGHTMCGTQCVHIYNFLQLKSLVFAANKAMKLGNKECIN